MKRGLVTAMATGGLLGGALDVALQGCHVACYPVRLLVILVLCFLYGLLVFPRITNHWRWLP